MHAAHAKPDRPALPLAPIQQFDADVREKLIPRLFSGAERRNAEALLLPLLERRPLMHASMARLEEDMICREITMALEVEGGIPGRRPGYRPRKLHYICELDMAERVTSPYQQAFTSWLYKAHGGTIAEKLGIGHATILAHSSMGFGTNRSLAWYYLCFKRMNDVHRMRKLLPVMHRAASLLIFGSTFIEDEWAVMTGA